MMQDIPLDRFVGVLQKMSDWHRVNDDHDGRVAEMCLAIGARAGLDAEELEMLGYAARLHDVGRVGVDNEILTKPGKLTSSQTAAVRDHVLIGHELLKDTLPEIAEVVLCHHENFDGSGYPRGLQGAAIPLMARIVAIADRWDALRNTRPYRDALNFESAIHIMNFSTSHFDPVLYTIFLQLVREQR